MGNRYRLKSLSDGNYEVSDSHTGKVVGRTRVTDRSGHYPDKQTKAHYHAQCIIERKEDEDRNQK